MWCGAWTRRSWGAPHVPVSVWVSSVLPHPSLPPLSTLSWSRQFGAHLKFYDICYSAPYLPICTPIKLSFGDVGVNVSCCSVRVRWLPGARPCFSLTNFELCNSLPQTPQTHHITNCYTGDKTNRVIVPTNSQQIPTIHPHKIHEHWTVTSVDTFSTLISEMETSFSDLPSYHWPPAETDPPGLHIPWKYNTRLEMFVLKEYILALVFWSIMKWLSMLGFTQQ